MRYEIKKNDRIRIQGDTEQIREWVKEISSFMDKGMSYKMMEEDMNNLENIVDYHDYTFGAHHRIYYNKNSLLYVPNTSIEARKFHYKIFNKFFKEAKIKVDKKYETNPFKKLFLGIADKFYQYRKKMRNY